MAGRKNLSVLHAPLSASLSESKCSLLRRAHPNDGMVEPAVAAREAENLFFSQQMLAQARATDKHSYPLDRNVKPASFAHEAGNHFARKQIPCPPHALYLRAIL